MCKVLQDFMRLVPAMQIVQRAAKTCIPRTFVRERSTCSHRAICAYATWMFRGLTLSSKYTILVQDFGPANMHVDRQNLVPLPGNQGPPGSTSTPSLVH